MKFTTLAIHGDGKTTEHTGDVVPAIHLATAYRQPKLGEFQDYVYTRGSNPTRLALEKRLALLEDARYAFAFSSGMAAADTAFHLFNSGDRILLNDNVYGGTFRYASEVFHNLGLSYDLVEDFNTLNFDGLAGDVRGIFLESPSNPLLRVTDIRRLAEKAHERDIALIVDNTFMSAYLQKPLGLGADIVVYSATKYYSGHSDILAGALALNDGKKAERVRLLQNTLGNPLSPADSYQLERSIKTLALRMDRQCANAAAVVDMLRVHPKVKRVFYPSVDEESRRIQESQSRGFGAVLSFILRDGCDPARFIGALSLFDFAVSLGSVESLVCHPASQTHESFPPEFRKKAGIEDGLLRLSVGIEDIEDLLSDLERALEAA
ncbi:MAG: PLP-dependent aspartate aminotransferase family protein [Spirochaetaceae bacterium]|jgi:cystathionine beta-lyase|nr:PLP-dependent aspartate aminotransferase family protein [Spirochaetaceae bacterium]